MSTELSVEQMTAAGLDEQTARDLAPQVNDLLCSLPPAECWSKLTDTVLKPDLPFDLHLLLHRTVFEDWDANQGPAPAWLPSEEYIKTTNIGRLMHELDMDSYQALHTWFPCHRPSIA